MASNKTIAVLNVLIGAQTKQFEQAMRRSETKMQRFQKNVNKIGAGIGAFIAFDALRQGISNVVDTTATFEAYEAVLKNTLGTQEQAVRAMQMIQDTAAGTPFQIDKLTESYISLVNRGYKPTRDEILKLGDLASAAGKDFNQLAEALLDAQVAEFERLKEFGIKAKKDGDVVQFTFKGVTKEVENSEEAITNYILSLGDLKGVTGAMSAESETLKGKISNLDDNLTILMATIGSSSSGLTGAILDFANDGLSTATKLLRGYNKEVVTGSEVMLALAQDMSVLGIFLGDPGSAMDAALEKIKAYDEQQKKLNEYRNTFEEVFDRERAAQEKSAEVAVKASEEKILAWQKYQHEMLKEQSKNLGTVQKRRDDKNMGRDPLEGVLSDDRRMGMISEMGGFAIDSAANMDALTASLAQMAEQYQATSDVIMENSKTGAEAVSDFGMSIGHILGESMGSYEDLATTVTRVAGQFIKEQIRMALVAAVAQEVATKGPLAILTGGLAAGAALGLFEKVLSSIPKFGNGGIVSGPTLAVVGESGPEEIRPLRGGRSGMGGGAVDVSGRFEIEGDRLVAIIRKELTRQGNTVGLSTV